MSYTLEAIPPGTEPEPCSRCGAMVYRVLVPSPYPGDAPARLRVSPDAPGGKEPTATEPGLGMIHVLVCSRKRYTPGEELRL